MVDSLSKECCPTPLLQAKLGAVRKCVKTGVFGSEDARGLLLPTCCHHLKAHLLEREEIDLCADIMGDIITFLQEKILEDRKSVDTQWVTFWIDRMTF